VLMTRNCGCPVSTTSIEATAERHGIWPVQPSTYTGGWEHWRVFSRDQEAMRSFVAEVERNGEIELLSHRARSSLDVVDQFSAVGAQIFAGLTDRQLEVLATALEEGLLDVPARGSMDRAARRIGVSRSTYGEHLRKAVRQLVGNAAPFIKPPTQ
jgi:predicted DNA binding protein